MKMRGFGCCGQHKNILYFIVFYKPVMADTYHICLCVNKFNQHYRTNKRLMVMGKNKWTKEPPRGTHALLCSRPGEDELCLKSLGKSTIREPILQVATAKWG